MTQAVPFTTSVYSSTNSTNTIESATNDGCQIQRAFIEVSGWTPESVAKSCAYESESFHASPLGRNSDQLADSTLPVRPSPPTRPWWCGAIPPLPPPAPDASIHIHAAAAGTPSLPLPTRPSPPGHPHHQPCSPQPGPTVLACMVNADSELARALAADPFHLDWPHW